MAWHGHTLALETEDPATSGFKSCPSICQENPKKKRKKKMGEKEKEVGTQHEEPIEAVLCRVHGFSLHSTTKASTIEI